jgi:hypothetical protein
MNVTSWDGEPAAVAGQFRALVNFLPQRRRTTPHRPGRRPRLATAVAAALLAAALLVPAQSAAKTTWLCHPRLASDPCRPGLETTVFSPWDRQVGVDRPRRLRRPKIDCFYVYPTVSDQPTRVADRTIDPPLQSIALYQAARYSQLCRVYAPVYRQLTLRAIGGSATEADRRIAYGDVRAAWREYLARHNHGRGFVLIGHSQGGAHLPRLVRREIDRRPAVRRRLVSAILLGTDVVVRRRRDAGGSFRNVRACRSRRQIGCVIAFSAFGETPPPDSIFGRPRSRLGRTIGQPSGRRYEVLCTNPAALRGGSAPLRTILPTAPFAPGSSIAAGIALLGITPPQASTPFLEARRAYSGRCSRAGGANFLRIASRDGTPMPKPSPDATWGLHLLDGNVALGDLVDLVRAQAERYRAIRH